MDCLFCQIVEKQIPAKLAFENETLMAFHDIDPKAPVHLLIIPKYHLENLGAMTEDHVELMGQLCHCAANLAKEFQLSGYRLVTNIGEQGGQSVYHLHWHLLGGRDLGWPPG